MNHFVSCCQSIPSYRNLNQFLPKLRAVPTNSYFDGWPGPNCDVTIRTQYKGIDHRTVLKEVVAQKSYLRHNDCTIFMPPPLPCYVVLSLEHSEDKSCALPHPS